MALKDMVCGVFHATKSGKSPTAAAQYYAILTDTGPNMEGTA
jgi:hypothetical protein